VVDPRSIWSEYAKGWFLVDLLASLPFDFIFAAAVKNSQVGVAGRLLKVLRIGRVFRLSRVARFDLILSYFEDKLGMNPRIFRLLLLLVQVLFIGHLTACTWWALPTLFSAHPWYHFYGYENEPLLKRYVFSLYWTFTTLCTVGYGDVVAHNSAEQVIACIIMLIGASLFGYVAANVATMAEFLDEAGLRIKASADEVRSRRYFIVYTL